MQRLKQHNEGAALPLAAGELLSATTTQMLPDRRWCVVRMRLSLSGEAERSVHVHGDASGKTFLHERVTLPAETVAALSAAIRAAFGEREPEEQPAPDPQALYRKVVFRDDDARPRALAVEYRHGKAVGSAEAFESAWRLLASQFPRTGPEVTELPDLRW
jgi:hypothetical protein